MPWYEYSAQTGGQPRPLAEIRLRRGDRNVRVVGFVDSGADFSVFDITIADTLGLDRSDAQLVENVGPGASSVPTYRWPDARLEIQFEGERFPFTGSFVPFPPGAEPLNLLGRRDFFRRFIVQFWDAAEMMNIDLSPDFPRPPLSD
jgi:hypothetical protein